MPFRITTAMTFLVITLSVLTLPAHAAPSDREVADIITKTYSHCRYIPIGKNAVGNQQLNSQFLTNTQLKFLRAMSRAGLIVLEEGAETPPTQMFLAGVIKQINVVATAAGLEASKNCSSLDKQLAIEVDTQKVDKIITNEEAKNAVDTFRVVKGIATLVPTDAGVRFYNEFGTHDLARPQQLKFIKLLKFDSFTNQWKVVATDTIGVNYSDFKSNNVRRYLAGPSR